MRFRAALLLLLASCVSGELPEEHPSAYPDHARLLVYLDAEGREQTLQSPRGWERRRLRILENFQAVAGPMPGDERRVPLDVQVVEETRLDHYSRKLITFAVEPGDRVPALLLIPHDLKKPAPAVLCLHQTTPLGKSEPAGMGNRNLSYAAELAERGFVTLAPDYPGYGDYKIDVYAMGYVSATMKGIWNHRRAVDLLQSLPEVDPKQIGVIGHSLGGHNSLFAAAFEPRIKAVVTSCGFTAFLKYYGGNLAGWSHKGYMPRIATLYEKDPRKMPFDFPEILGAIAPRALFINAPLRDSNFEVSGVKDCVEAALPVYDLLGDRSALEAVYPDAPHTFPIEERLRAYAFLERSLK